MILWKGCLFYCCYVVVEFVKNRGLYGISLYIGKSGELMFVVVVMVEIINL